MSQVKDPKIKLFGKTIGMPETSKAAGICELAAESCDTDAEYSVNQNHARSILQHSDFNGDREYRESQEKQPGPGQHRRNERNQSQPSPSNESKATNACTPPSDNSKERQIEPSNSDEKNLKKPDKILPCPRCNSMDTKFCYFNNYNVNQPRHFCKNCQRYWTDGGAMRNVPIGAGRRKNKNQAASQFHPVAVSEATCRENPNETSFLAFGSDTRLPLCESSMVPVLNIGDNAIERKEDNGHEHSSEPLNDEVPFVDGVPLPYPWHSAQWSPSMAPTTFGTSNYPMHFYPTAPPYWAGSGLWNAPNSPTLGKHSRDESTTANSENEQEKRKESDPDTRLWVPKTLRLDDPGEASRSSILSTLGIDSDRADVGASGGGGLVEAFRRKSKDGVRNRSRECSSTVLQSNLAALSRSVGFHESS